MIICKKLNVRVKIFALSELAYLLVLAVSQCQLMRRWALFRTYNGERLVWDRSASVLWLVSFCRDPEQVHEMKYKKTQQCSVEIYIY